MKSRNCIPEIHAQTVAIEEWNSKKGKLRENLKSGIQTAESDTVKPRHSSAENPVQTDSLFVYAILLMNGLVVWRSFGIKI